MDEAAKAVINTTENLKLFVETSNLFEGEPTYDFVDEAYFGHINPELIKEVPGDGDAKVPIILSPDAAIDAETLAEVGASTDDGPPFLGLKLVDALPDSRDMVAEAMATDALAMVNPASTAISVVASLLERSAPELAEYSGEIPGPVGGQPCIERAVVGRVVYRGVPWAQ